MFNDGLDAVTGLLDMVLDFSLSHIGNLFDLIAFIFIHHIDWEKVVNIGHNNPQLPRFQFRCVLGGTANDKIVNALSLGSHAILADNSNLVALFLPGAGNGLHVDIRARPLE